MLAQHTLQTGIGFFVGAWSLTRHAWNNFPFQTVSLETRTKKSLTGKNFCSKMKE